MKRKIKVLIVDDSLSTQNVLAEIFSHDNDIEVIGVASDPYEAVSKIAAEAPDVITLDVEMPRMDGLTFLSKLMKQHPIPVVVISSVAEKGSDLGIRALKLGASEVITKPILLDSEHFEEYRIRIIDAVKASAQVVKVSKLRSVASSTSVVRKVEKVNEPDSLEYFSKPVSKRIILIGASTGGTEVLAKILKNLKPNLPGILIVQHMPGEFTGAFAKRLNTESNLLVKEAEDGEVVRDGCVYVANGFNHLYLVRGNGVYHCKLKEGELVNRHRPSVDVLFKSAIKLDANKIIAALLTGMGNDGAMGLLELKEAGAMTFAQDEKSSVVFGMPREAIKLNAAQIIGSPDELIDWLNTNFQTND